MSAHHFARRAGLDINSSHCWDLSPTVPQKKKKGEREEKRRHSLDIFTLKQVFISVPTVRLIYPQSDERVTSVGQMKKAMHEEYKFKGLLKCRKSQRWDEIKHNYWKKRKAKLVCSLFNAPQRLFSVETFKHSKIYLHSHMHRFISLAFVLPTKNQRICQV